MLEAGTHADFGFFTTPALFSPVELVCITPPRALTYRLGLCRLFVLGPAPHNRSMAGHAPRRVYRRITFLKNITGD